jgi:sulfopyruvate decarboxylase subunit alpha
MGGRKTAILMQNSGLGNSINALKSLTELYHFPLVMIMSHRGTEGESICGQVPMGEATPRLLDAMDFTYSKPDSPEEAYEQVKESWNNSLKEGKPVSILLEISYW